MAASTFFRSFQAGELSPALASRADLPIYGAGLRTCRNFLIGRHGAAINRPGTLLTRECKTTSANVRLVRYVHEVPGESVLIEMGAEYFRFFLNGVLVVIEPGDFPAYDNGEQYEPGQVVTSGGAYYVNVALSVGNAPPDTDFWSELDLDGDGNLIYEIPHPFTEPREVKWAQSGRVITFVHQSTRPRDLTYFAADFWELTEVTTVAQAGTPQNPAVAQDPDEVEYTFEVGAHYAVAGDVLTGVEFTDTFGTASVARPVTLTWDEPTNGPPEYYTIWRRVGGSLYLIGTTDNVTTTFDYTGQADGDPWEGSAGGAGDEPSNLDATQGPATPILSTFRYVVTAVVAGEESFASDVAEEELEDPSGDRPHDITCDAVAEATEYRFYADPEGGGDTFGRIGTSASPIFSYDGTPAPDYNVTPPVDSEFFGVDDFPAAVGYYQQRRWFGNRPSSPDSIQGSRVAQPDNFTVSSPVVDDDAISFRLIGREQHAVREILGVNDLVVLTDGGEWRSRTSPGDPLTPFNLPFNQDTYVGIAATPRPCLIGNTIVYVQARNRKVVEAKFQQDTESLANRDLTILASHLFDSHIIRALDYQYEAHSIVWAVRDDGGLLGMTYIEGADLVGWHRHDTAGEFEDVCVIPEENEDVVYAIVARDLGGVKRFIERLANREEALVFTDASVQHDGAPITDLDGLDHLEGETVKVYADGAALADKVVASGSIALGGSYSQVSAGLAIVADLETLDLDAAGTDVRDRKKRIASVGLLVDASVRNFQTGPSADKLKRITALGSAFSGYVEMSIVSGYDMTGRVFLRHDQPTPLTVLGILPRVDLGA